MLIWKIIDFSMFGNIRGLLLVELIVLCKKLFLVFLGFWLIIFIKKGLLLVKCIYCVNCFYLVFLGFLLVLLIIVILFLFYVI